MSFGPRHTARVTYGAGQFIQQVRNGQQLMAKYHELLIEAGAVWDGLDGYDVTPLPEGKAHEAWLEASRLANGPGRTSVPGITGQRAGPAEG